MVNNDPSSVFFQFGDYVPQENDTGFQFVGANPTNDPYVEAAFGNPQDINPEIESVALGVLQSNTLPQLY